MYIAAPVLPRPTQTAAPLRVARQEEEDRVHVITQTIRRPATTFITYVTLGPGDPTPIPEDPTAPTPISAPTMAPPPPGRGDGSLSSVQIGGILGGVVAFVAIVLIAWYCVTAKRPPRRQHDFYDSDYDYMYDDSTASSSLRASPRPPRPPSGPVPPRRDRPMYPQPYPPTSYGPPLPRVNQYGPWNVATNGPRRHQRARYPPWDETPIKRPPKMNGPRRVERPRWGWPGRY
ncbi:hypothetical protein C8034_v007006 [Colletotrichum sidae]|uniref:Uncharacterized protein n=1 Tax=Colletotrichum sidae TaxID=1347389 RepID=A0A4R8TU20_9PEZI|nr:hypothetical protein C8034_v007006 [Colletotrichum sidae]